MSNKFYYFGFGSNMLAKRIHIQNPTAKRIGMGKLENYRLDFNTSSKNWLGAPATIVPTLGSAVFGAIWEIDNSNMKDLDNQEGVSEGIYMPINVPVYCIQRQCLIDCRAYHLTKQPISDLHSFPNDSEIPLERKPSKTYLKTIIKGAQETGVPTEYVDWLRSVQHNGRVVDDFENLLDLHDIQLKHE